MNEKLEMDLGKQPFVSAKDKFGYPEEYIIVKRDKAKNDLLLNYSLSNSLDDIKIAIFNRTGLNLKIEKARWGLNPHLSVSVKHLMNKHQVRYSMASYYEDDVRIVCMNMRVGDNWFIARYAELEDSCYDIDYLNTFEEIKKKIKNYLSKQNGKDDD